MGGTYSLRVIDGTAEEVAAKLLRANAGGLIPQEFSWDIAPETPVGEVIPSRDDYFGLRVVAIFFGPPVGSRDAKERLAWPIEDQTADT